MDTSATAWGEDWPTALESAIAGAEVVIVVMGPRWLHEDDEWGRRRIDRPDDWVRREIELALAGRKTILPLLVGDVRMPPAEALPPELAELANKQGLRCYDEGWEQHVQDVLAKLAEHIRPSAEFEAEPQADPRTQSIQNEFRAVASGFYGAPLAERVAAAEECAGIGGLLELDDVLAFARSRVPADKVGAAIALAAHLRTSEVPRKNPDVQQSIRALLNDKDHSRVRYRAAELLRDFPALAEAYEDDLAFRARRDSNPYVQTMAQKALRHAGLSS
jgi:TIR domain-containing protein